MRLRPSFLWGIWVAAVVGIPSAGGWTWIHRPPPALPLLGQVPDFNLTDESGAPFDRDRLLGKAWVADFIFTSCAGQCPQMTAQMQALQRRLPPEVHLVSITVDPVRDSPEVLAQYAKAYQAQPGRWHFLTGDPAGLSQLALEGFRLSYAKGGPPEEPITHSIRLVLVDPTGSIRGYYDGTDPKAVQRLIKDADGLLDDSSSHR